MIETCDVVVVGAGPVGLLAAIELTLAGARAVVLERLSAPSLVAKALGIGPLGIEALQRRGMAAPIAEAEQRMFSAMKAAEPPGAPVRGPGSKFVGHFAGLSLIRAAAQKEPARRGRPVDQQAAEAMLGDRARALGIEVRRGCEVTGFTQRDAGVDVHWRSATEAGRIDCAWLVGCDGGRSLIRKMAGIDFPGSPPSLTMVQATVKLDHPEKLRGPGWHRTSGGVFSFGFLPGKLILLDFSGPPSDRDAPVTRDEVEAALRRISGADVRVETLGNASRWTDNTRLVDSYRRGRVLLAGDAAHVHAPFGGQGMSLGLVDAANLGWKLAAVVRGDMPESLLDTYTAERRPVAEAVLANTLAQAAIMRPDPQAGAMRDLMARLLDIDDVNRHVGELMNGLFARYDLGSNREEVGRLIADRPVGAGRHDDIDSTNCNDESHADAARARSLYDAMQDGRGVFLDTSKDGAGARTVAAITPKPRCIAAGSGPSMLIRPDGCVAWAADGDDPAGLAEALHRWFGPGTAALGAATLLAP